MGKVTGFKEFSRQTPAEQPVESRVKHYGEFIEPLAKSALQQQGARCMDCGVPFCQSGCPLGNTIPDWNDLVFRGDWESAISFLSSTNNFPEFTGRICPAPCEEACVLGINQPAVTIKNIESSIVETAFQEGWIKPFIPKTRSGRQVAVVGSGPAGLACAAQLNQAGHEVTVFERSDKIGGLLRYGIPDFKLEKWVIDRRIALMEEEGVRFRTGINIGFDLDADDLSFEYDAIVLCAGSTRPRDLQVPGRELDGVHFAMNYLTQQNRRVAGNTKDAAGPESGWWYTDSRREILAGGKNVIVIGGGDTGSDCVGTANRQGAASVTQFEIAPMPPEGRPDTQPWPFWPLRLRTSSSHKEGCSRHWSIMTKEIVGAGGQVTGLKTVDVEWLPAVYPIGAPSRGPQLREIPGTEKIWPADLVFLAMGFAGPEQNGIVMQMQLDLDSTHNIRTDSNYMTSRRGIFACGDARRGQSLVVWAISEGRECARSIDNFLMGSTELPKKGAGDLPRV